MLKSNKEQKPLFTINRIRSILNDLGIFVTKKHIEDSDYFTCRLELANDQLQEFGIGINGKGTSLDYACASAFAEFMERLQNNHLIRVFLLFLPNIMLMIVRLTDN